MKRLVTVVVGLLLLVGCAPEPVRPEPVPLVTWDRSGCFLAPLTGLLVADPAYGTRIVLDDGSSEPEPIVVWQHGFTARREGTEVEVRDSGGAVVAVTGSRYTIGGGYVRAYEVGIPGGALAGGGLTPVWWGCGPVTPA